MHNILLPISLCQALHWLTLQVLNEPSMFEMPLLNVSALLVSKVWAEFVLVQC
jgi:hypothetical protein